MVLGRSLANLAQFSILAGRQALIRNRSQGHLIQTSTTKAILTNHATILRDQLHCKPMSSVVQPQGGNKPQDVVRNPSAAITYDDFNHQRYIAGDTSKRAFTYFVLSGGRFIYASAIRLAVLKFILSMQASKDVLALASLEVDVSKIDVGNTITVKWRGKPVFIKHRSDEDVQECEAVDTNSLRDPQSDAERRVERQWLVLVGVCTHLGCVPISGAGDFNGWFCPCHGSHYDGSGRIRKGPAPYNLEVPEYKFTEPTKLLIG
mmetsp:Transcript_11539/g.40127  ORF Transcript_11539/g.40127 Transcript_11539/m.40127 type:complete len:262 (-) Transcript_11539:400-1185(-)|eukprot:CAMPEP_0183792844 /NCGR_PEP_ID=MMETSP0803_2-20130417/2834_1 /TAXON_ID=195967 /ORGANISM="Crustomastix stigmata, Strain CCMP3273" /LENGTH=261 /DNA_ID=CAMNT_0026037213 /DNA_START=64 /DNA_END=849 /DNA_ORIENTATION=-